MEFSASMIALVFVTWLLIVVDSTRQDNGQKRLVLFAGPHFSREKDVEAFFSQNHDADSLQDWRWPTNLGPLTKSSYKGEVFRLLVTEANHDEVQDEMLSGMRNQWEEAVKGIIVGTEEFDRVGLVPYSHYDGISAMARVVHAVNLTGTPDQVTVVVNYRAPRVDHWLSTFKHDVQGHDHYKGFVCSRNEDIDNYELLWETIDTALNPLNLAFRYRKRGWKVVVIDLSGVDATKNDIAHVIACDVLQVPCTSLDGQTNWVDGLSDVTYDIDRIDRDILSVDADHQADLERLFRRRDCTYQMELENDDRVTILYRETIWNDCEAEAIHIDMVPHLRDSSALLSAIRSQKGCSQGVTMNDLLEDEERVESSYNRETERVVAIAMTVIGLFLVYNMVAFYRMYIADNTASHCIEPTQRWKMTPELTDQQESRGVV